jgi:surface antigen
MEFFRYGRATALLFLASSAYFHVSAENICNETPPATRAVDGIPAYAQCSTSTGSVYSNNGVDTKSTSGGAGWIRTQMGGGYQCTEFAHRYLAFHWNVKSTPGGNAGSWGDDALPTGLVKTTAPVHGDLIVFAPGSCGASSSTGHIAVIDSMSGTSLTIVEQNGASRRSCKASCAKCFLHAQANTGIPFVSSAAASTDADPVSVRRTSGMLLIRMNGDAANGASVLICDLRGRRIADISGRMRDGQTWFETDCRPNAAYFMTVRKGNRVICTRMLFSTQPK